MSADPQYKARIAFLPESAPFTPAQRFWLDGFFAGLLTQSVAVQAPPEQKPSLTVLFASQTGTAESLARKLAKTAKGQGFQARALELGEFDLAGVAALGQVAVIASTHGEGEPPDSAAAFAQAMKAAEGMPLAGLSYAVLALGDSNYARFCRFGADMDECFARLGATRLLERMECDGDTDAPFKAFRETFMKVVNQSAPGGAQAIEIPQPDEEEDGEAQTWSRKRPFPAKLLYKVNLNGPKSDKETRHVEIAIDGAELPYEPGDALGVMPQNSPETVAAVLAVSRLDGGVPVEIDGATLPLQEALTRRLEIGKLTQPTVIKFQVFAESARLAQVLEPDNVEDRNAYLWGRELIDLLVEHPRVAISPQELADMLPRLAPRLYSIASSPKAHPGQVHLTIATVRYESHGRPRGGVASTWVADWISQGGDIPVYVHRNTRFRLPEDGETPVIMIGPGTGIAPFRAFLEERRAVGAAGRNWLFFGDRRAAHDFLYREELEGFKRDGLLTRLDAAFSRDGPDKVYVQHLMRENAAELWRWIRDGAHIYVCGDASAMARDVNDALCGIIAAEGRMSDAEAKLEVGQLTAARRYCRDVY